MLRVDIDPRVAVAPGPEPARTDFAASRIVARPVSMPTGRAPDKQNLIPLYSAGLCEAVNIAPGASSLPAAKYTRSVLANPRSSTLMPREVTPLANEAARDSPVTRMSRATMTIGALTKSANATPSANATSSFISFGVVPRMSYALTMRSRTEGSVFINQ